jgi:hypothetical protein
MNGKLKKEGTMQRSARNNELKIPNKDSQMNDAIIDPAFFNCYGQLR